MDQILDGVWAHFEIVLTHTVTLMDKAISPLEVFGPGFVILFLALGVVLFTRTVSKIYVTKRFVMLKNEFEHWHSIRKEAMKHPDPEKAKALAKNIDQAELNRAYYDYFFEGMLKNMVTNVLPILLTAAFITTIYTPERLMARFDDKWVYSFTLAGSPVQISSLFWYVICLLAGFIAYAVIKKLVKKRTHQPELAKTHI